MKQIVWARWEWEDTGPGKWHVVAETGLDASGHPAVVLACGRARHLPSTVAMERPEPPLCPECVAFDDMRLRYTPETADQPAVPVPA